MSLFSKRLLKIMAFVMSASVVVCVTALIIFLLDMDGAKGLVPLIFFCLVLFFFSQFLSLIILSTKIEVKKKWSYSNSNFLLGIVSLIFFIMSLYVFWV